MLLDFQFKTSERLIMAYVTRKSGPGFGGIVFKICLNLVLLARGRRIRSISSVAVMDLLRGVEVV